MAQEDNRTKALNAALSQIDRQFGKGTVMRLGDAPRVEMPSVSTGSLGLDIALGIGGLPFGRVVEIFGPESSGLSNKDLSFSNYILQIPTSIKFKSLNLSHSLTIVCYEIFKLINKTSVRKNSSSLKIAAKSNISSVLKHLVNLLEKKDFFIPIEKKHSMLLNVNNLIYRLEPNDKELRILASIISSLGKNSSKA